MTKEKIRRSSQPSAAVMVNAVEENAVNSHPRLRVVRSRSP